MNKIDNESINDFVKGRFGTIKMMKKVKPSRDIKIDH